MSKSYYKMAVAEAEKRQGHPGCRQYEVCLGNVTKEEYEAKIGHETKRLGQQAYDTLGNPANCGLLPVFVGKAEFILHMEKVFERRDRPGMLEIEDE